MILRIKYKRIYALDADNLISAPPISSAPSHRMLGNIKRFEEYEVRLTGAQERRWVRATGCPSGEGRALSGRPSEMPEGQSAAQAAGHGAALPSCIIYICQSRIRQSPNRHEIIIPCPCLRAPVWQCMCMLPIHPTASNSLCYCKLSDKKHMLSEPYVCFHFLVTQMHKTS
jgi:hypothetical protein